MVEGALLALEMVKRGAVAINGSTGTVLSRNLLGLKTLVEAALSDIRQDADHQRRQRTSVSFFLMDLSLTARLRAEDRGLRFELAAVDPALVIHVDSELLRSAVTNLLENAFKFTPTGGRVALSAQIALGRLLIEVEDDREGMQRSVSDPIRSPDEGLSDGLELSRARQAARALGGHITLRNMPGKGPIFSLELATEAAAEPALPL